MRPDLPAGVVTLVFTDIEGSTRLLAEMRGGYVQALAEHRGLIRTAAVAHGGVEVDTQGDSFLLAFARPSDAIEAAIEAQRSLDHGPVKIRIGIHTGEPELTDEGYVGMDVHRGARICDAGHGGQILMSASTRSLVDITAIDLGRHRLDGVEDPEHIFEVRAEGLASGFPALRALSDEAPSLPPQLTSFVGRAIELTQIDERLDDPGARIVTLVGPGGAGKTRLAIEAAKRRWSGRGERAVFASVVAAADEDGVVNAITDAVGLPVDMAHGAGRTALEQLADYLASRPGTIIVDNFEHVADAGEVLSRIVSAAGGITLLVTSRQRLGLRGEWVVEVHGLGSTGSTMSESDSAERLFIERARQSKPGFTVSDDAWALIRRICERLDGMPLGIELAAAWAATLSLADLAAEVERNLDLLETDALDVPEKHRSLRAAFAGSWRLLDIAQQEVFAGLSVFVGSFDREGATALTGVDDRGLARLAARSLIRRRPDERFEIHELLRQYAAEALEAAGQTGILRERHARLFAERLADSEDELSSPASPEARERLEPDTPNLRAAVTWAAAHWTVRDVEPLMRIGAALWTMSVNPATGEIHAAVLHAAETERDPHLDTDEPVPLRVAIAGHVSFALAIVDDNDASDRIASAAIDPLRAAGLTWHVALCQMVQGINAANRFEDAVAVPILETALEGLGNEREWVMRAELGTWLGWSRLMLDDATGARAAFDAAYAISVEVGEPLAIAFCQSKLGLLEDVAGRYREALTRHLDAFASFDAVGNRGGVGYSLSRASLSAYCLDDRQTALDFAQIAYDGFAELNHHWGLIVVTGRLAYAYLGLGRVAEARAWALHSLELSRSGYRLGQLHALGAVAGALVRSGDAVEGRRLLRATLADPDLPAMFAIQARAELEAAEAVLADGGPTADDAEAIDLDAVIAKLLSQKHPAPVAL